MRKTISATNGFSFQYGGPPTANHSQQHSTATGYQQNIQMRNNHLTGSTPALHNHPPNGGGLLNNGNSANGYKKGISSSTQHLHSQPSLTGGVQQRGDQNSPAYYYSSTLGTPSRSSAGAGSQQAPATQREQFHSTTTTLRSNKETPTDQRSMDYKSSAPNSIPPASQFGRRHTAAGAHEFHGGPALPQQHIPAYSVEHLASFAVGKQFGLTSPSDGVRKLKQMERNSAICPVPMLFTLHPDRVAVLEENGTLVEEFPLALVTDPTAHISSDPDDFFNNVLLFVVREHDVPSSSSGGVVPTEMHIFQCIGVSAQEAAEDLHHYTRGHFHKVRPGRRGIDGSQSHNMPPYQAVAPAGPYPIARAPYPPREDDMVGAESNGAEYFEMDVNTLNRCFDDIERFVARIQSAAIAQRELDMQQRRSSSKKRGGKKDKNAQAAAQNGILQLRAQMPSYGEFSEIFQKFKLCFNLLAKLKNHIHEPSAPELLHFLFTPLMVILDACQWGLGQQVAQQVYSPLLSLDACELLRTYLYPKEMEVWMALGKAWNTAPEDWPGPLPPPYRPVFLDGYAPYGYPQQGAARLPPPAATRWDSRPTNGRPQPQAPFPQQHPPRYSSAPAPIHRGMSAPTMPQQPPPRPQQSNFYGGAYGQVPPATSASTANLIAAKIDNIELERINLEKERLEFERRKVLDKERELLEQERRLREEAERLEHERRQLHRESEKHSIAESDRPDFYRGVPSMHASPRLDRRTGSVQVLPNGSSNGHAPASSSSTHSNTATYAPISSPRLRNGQQSSQTMLEQSSPRQKAFLEDLARRGCKVVQVTYDRNACNAKELTVTRGEYLEVLNDSRNWWECRNVHSRSGFVPHTILSVLSLDDWEQEGGGMEEPGGKPAVHERKQRQIAAAESAPSSAAVPAADCLSKIPLEVRQEQRYVPELLESMRKKDRLGARRTSSVHSSSSAPSLDANSDHQQVQQWLMQKGFSEQTRTALSLCSAKDLFEMEKEEFDLLCGEAADRIHSLVLAAKRQSNYDQASADEKQLNNLLTIRRLALESQEDQNDQMLKEPAERPPTLGRSQSYKLAFMAREVKEEEPPEREEECVEAHSVRSYL